MSADVRQRNNVQIQGRGQQPMLFAHGFGCDQNMWRYITPSFADAYRLVLFDYVGSGKSDIAAYNEHRYGTLDGYAQDILEVCDALDLKDVILVGHSVSGVIGMLAAIREPALFARLIMVCPSPRYVNDAPDYIGGFERADIEGLLEMMDKNYLGWASFLAPTVMKNADQPELTQELEESFCSTDPIIARRFAEVTFLSDNREDLPLVTVPSLILQCADDLIAPLEIGDYLHQHLSSSELRVMKATGHCPHMSHPDETARLIQHYLDSSQ